MQRMLKALPRHGFGLGLGFVRVCGYSIPDEWHKRLNPKPETVISFRSFEALRGSSLLGRAFGLPKWEFPKIRGSLFVGPYNRDPTI